MDSSQRLEWLFAQYLERRCAPEEVEELTTLLQQADAEERLSGPMEELWKKIREDGLSLPDYAVDWDKMYEAVRQSEADILTLNRRRIHRTRRIWYSAAAALVLLLASTAAYRVLTGKGGKDPAPQSVAGINSLAGVNNIGRRQLPNKKQVIHLPDGSTVILNTDSKLDYPRAFAGHTRDVYLSGEAYFDITHRVGQPFLVHTGKITTRVLGTAFDVRAYPADDSIRITVTQGKVQVLKENHRMELLPMGLLTADQQISFSKLTEVCVQNKKVDVTPVIAWKPQEISFDDITMQQAATEIEQRFHVRISFANPVIKDCRVTATFYEDDMLSEILTVICGVSQSDYTIQNNKIIIDGKGCN
jgi:transmembrane sensor